MSVLIKGMEMPTSCSECAFCGYYGNKTHICDINQQTIDYEDMLKNRRDDCPLIPVPKHGRLIDADELCKTIIYAKADDFLKAGVISYVKAADTVMEAEREE